MVQCRHREEGSGVFVGGCTKAEPSLVQRRDHDVGSGVCTGVQQGQVPKYFSARLKMLAQACFQGSWTWVALSLVHAGTEIWAHGCLSLLGLVKKPA